MSSLDIDLQGRPPAPRAAHAGATLGCKGYICGGRVMVSCSYLIVQQYADQGAINDSLFHLQETRTSDIHCLDIQSWTWSEMSVNKN